MTALLLAGLCVSPAGALGKFVDYRVAELEFTVEEVGSYKIPNGTSWSGDGHRHETLGKEETETPALPISLPSKGGQVFAGTEVLLEGSETLVDPQGKRESCSGSWEKNENASILVGVKPAGPGQVQSTWEVPHGTIATQNCGVGADLIRPGLKVKSVVDGEIGDRRLVLTVKGSKEMEEPSPNMVKQKLRWKGKLVLSRGKHH